MRSSPPLRFFGAMVFAGAGGFGNLYYAYYLRDKGIGMGGRIPELLTSALRGAGDETRCAQATSRPRPRRTSAVSATGSST